MALDPVAAVRQLLYRQVKVALKDGRIIVGDFSCLDKQGNLILANTYEHVPAKEEASGSSTPAEQRHMGMVLVPAAFRTSVLVQVTEAERPAIEASLLGAPRPVAVA